jgi:hypothetical protein
VTDDPTQVPPFGVAAVITDGKVTDIRGVCNAHWITEQADPTLVLAPEGTAIGDLYDGTTFTRPEPETLPEHEAMEDTNG